ncbi:MAG: signal peptidase I [Candidatus Taylorbacteria bacterium]
MDSTPHNDKENLVPSIATPSSTFWKTIWEWVKVIVIAVLISLPIRYFIAEPFIVNGASMDPTFSTGQFLIVDRLSYRFEKPQRGDVVVFQYPGDPSVYYIKRIIGLPGETMNIKDGIVTVTEKTSVTGASSTQSTTLAEPYIEADHAAHDNSNITLTNTQYFVMGDNRSQSSDSRVWGPLESHFITGRPLIRLLPPTSVAIFPGEYRSASSTTY